MESFSIPSSVLETIRILSSSGTLPLGLNKSALINVISSSASPGFANVPLLQLYFR